MDEMGWMNYLDGETMGSRPWDDGNESEELDDRTWREAEMGPREHVFLEVLWVFFVVMVVEVGGLALFWWDETDGWDGLDVSLEQGGAASIHPGERLHYKQKKISILQTKTSVPGPARWKLVMPSSSVDIQQTTWVSLVSSQFPRC